MARIRAREAAYLKALGVEGAADAERDALTLLRAVRLPLRDPGVQFRRVPARRRDPASAADARLSVRCTQTELDAMKALARAEGVDLATLVRTRVLGPVAVTVPAVAEAPSTAPAPVVPAPSAPPPPRPAASPARSGLLGFF